MKLHLPQRHKFLVNKPKIKIFNKIGDERKLLSPYDTLKVTREIPLHNFYPNEILTSNAFYGNAHSLKEKCNYSKDYRLKFAVQHGIYFGKQFFLPELNRLPNVLVWGKQTKKNLEPFTRKNIKAIGSPFFYSENFFSDEIISREKKRLGKNILLFPAHSTHLSNLSFDIQSFIDKIKEKFNDFDSIRACLYWKDCDEKTIESYKSNGIECVSAGHIFDYNFNARLKSLLSIADVTVSNAMGSYVGYSVYMNKPHIMFKNDYKLEGDTEGGRSEQLKKFSDDPYHNELIDLLLKSKFEIDKKVWDLCNMYWGFDSVLNKDDLKSLILETEMEYNSNFLRRYFYMNV